MQSRIKLNALALQHGSHFLERRFQRISHFQRVGSVLAGHGHQNTRLSLNERVSELWLRSLNHQGDVLDSHAQSIGMQDDYVRQGFRVYDFALRLKRDPLVRRFDETRAHHSGGKPCGGDHI